MKKASLAMFVVILTFMVTAIPAVAYGISDWVLGSASTEPDFTMSMAETPDGLQVTSKAFWTGENGEWSGVITSDKVQLDGFSIEIRFDKVPVVPDTGEAWLCFGFNNIQNAFVISEDASDNTGCANLVRYDGSADGILPTWESMCFEDGVWSTRISGPTDTLTAPIVDGTTLTFKAEKAVEGGYKFTLGSVTASDTFIALDDIFPDGKAYFYLRTFRDVEDSYPRDIQYTILSINGEQAIEVEA